MGSIHVTNQDFDKVVLNAHKPVIVDFWAPWCGPCRTLSPKLDQIAIDYDGRIVVVKVNVDEQPELAKRFNVRSLPSILVFGEGKEQLRSVGDLSLRVMRTAIDQILATPPKSGNDKESSAISPKRSRKSSTALLRSSVRTKSIPIRSVNWPKRNH